MPTTPRATAIRRAFEDNSYLNTGLTARAARKRCKVHLYAQLRRGEPHFKVVLDGESEPSGFEWFGTYSSGWGYWMLSEPFTSRRERRMWRRDLERYRANLDALAKRWGERVDEIVKVPVDHGMEAA